MGAGTPSAQWLHDLNLRHRKAARTFQLFEICTSQQNGGGKVLTKVLTEGGGCTSSTPHISTARTMLHARIFSSGVTWQPNCRLSISITSRPSRCTIAERVHVQWRNDEKVYCRNGILVGFPERVCHFSAVFYKCWIVAKVHIPNGIGLRCNAHRFQKLRGLTHGAPCVYTTKMHELHFTELIRITPAQKVRCDALHQPRTRTHALRNVSLSSSPAPSLSNSTLCFDLPCLVRRSFIRLDFFN